MTQVTHYRDWRNRDAMYGDKETRKGLTLRLVHATRSAVFYPIDLGHLLKSSWIEESRMEEINLGWRDESGSLLMVFKSAVSFLSLKQAKVFILFLFCLENPSPR